ncbi:hypothetical protein EV126DRAFT_437055 [Verticillium dahliae]|nr:hypothetical protein EV126DRAFT_437055 [Verticillium dahliae]
MADLATCRPLTRDFEQDSHELASTPRHVASRTGTKWQGRTPAKPTLRLYFKCENLQRIGAFKAAAPSMPLSASSWSPGGARAAAPSAAWSHTVSGNHAQALALAARESSIPAHIVMPSVSSPQQGPPPQRATAPSSTRAAPRASSVEAVANEVIAANRRTPRPALRPPPTSCSAGHHGPRVSGQARDLLPAGKKTSTPSAMVEREAGEAGWDLGLVFSGGNIAMDGLVEPLRGETAVIV